MGSSINTTYRAAYSVTTSTGEPPAAAPANCVTIGAAVVCQDGPAGSISQVWYDQHSHLPMYVVVRWGRLFPRQYIVALSRATTINETCVALDMSKRELVEQPEYRPDYEVAESIEHALYNAAGFGHGGYYLGIQVTVHNGIVDLRGNVRDSERRDEVEQIARGTRGVRDVRNRLITDDVLAEQVERALLQDGRLQMDDLRVEAFLGLADLRGRVSTKMHRALATMVAQHVPGVQVVNNALEIVAATERPGLQRAIHRQVVGAEIAVP